MALSLVDYLVKNCKYIHQHVASKSFMKSMVKLTEERKSFFTRLRDEDSNHLNMELREKTLVLIQIWANEFAKHNQYPIFMQTYNDLRGRGVRFPQV